MSSSNEAWSRRRAGAVAHGVHQAHPIHVERASNERVWDVDGNEYIDFTSGIAVLNTGHRHPHVVAALQAQLARFTHTCFAALPYADYIAVCERINALAPGTHPSKTALFSTGSEAVESALKIARAHTGRTGVVAFTNAFHGRTFATLALTGKVRPYSAGMGPMPGGVHRARYPDALNGVSVADALASIEQIFQADAAPDDIAALIFEPVQGEGGVQVAPVAFVERVRELCDRHGIAMIVDEVQSGIGRTGAFFAIEQMGVVPDLLVFGKSIAAGLPLAGVTGRADLVDAVAPGGLGGTYAGNPLACAAALAVLDVIERERLVARARQIGEIMQASLRAMQRRHAFIADMRGLGALIGVELRDPDGDRPATDIARRCIALARERGLLLLAGGAHGNVLRLLAPLTIGFDALEAGLAILDACLAECAAPAEAAAP
ncbi:4-aminobutyrate--2-oxoglutarate transaminase [Burkholderia oklahomensis]|uniref:4-aminobutyrate--2-oxoglutarate transaminase n=1 Tax=Burkholderia oklahomensis TaxID=342113 RepID=UPI00264FFFFF|nr:4-aminobutyrate--2-oxoglutarate transaminase [Burkholderia oklahomensis]MDN7672253.1 4-aminobutyrate--2-oxoglutarate transaminase [Burkholderia oklahomensis]